MKKKPGLLIIIAGPSGVGKSTVRNEVMKEKNLNLAFSVSFTTRKPRPNEEHGRDYFFVTKEEFLKAIKKGEFIEHAEFVGNLYGTSKTYVNKLREEGKNVILEIEVKGSKQVLDQFNKDEVISFFIMPPSLNELEKRIRGRSTESNEVIVNRLNKAHEEIKMNVIFDNIIVNDDPHRASNEIVNIINNKLKNRG